MKFRILTEEETAAAADRWETERILEAERRALCDACAADLGHDWELELEHPDADEDEGGGVDLRCTRCPAGINDVYTDGHELIWLDIDDEEGVVQEGRHHSPVPLIVPVDVDVRGWSIWTDYGYEYDAELLITQRGPARPVGEAA